MKRAFILGVAALGLGACNGSSGKCDTADTAGCVGGDSGTTGGGGGPELYEADYENCGSSSCTWYIAADGEVGTVELSVIENGDDSFEGGCNDAIGNGGLTCGVWAEYHNAFTTDSSNNDYGGDTKSITLDVLDNWENQQSNQSSLFDMSNATIENHITAMFVITDANGDYADCAKWGWDTSYFSECDNDWN